MVLKNTGISNFESITINGIYIPFLRITRQVWVSCWLKCAAILSKPDPSDRKSQLRHTTLMPLFKTNKKHFDL